MKLQLGEPNEATGGFMRLRSFTILLVLLTTSCGGTTGGPGNDEQGNNQPITLNISTGGGVLELPGIAKIEFPEGAFQSSMSLSIQKSIITDNVIQRYSNSSETVSAGQPYKNLLTILVPDQPKQDSVIQYVVPDEFLQQLNPQDKPALFARFVQSGADDEKIDDFTNLRANLSGNTLTAILPTWVFTDEYPETGGAFRSTIVLGSIPKGNKTLPTASQSFFLSSLNSCSGSNIGSPLERALEVTSQFGLRVHPISGKEKMHYGTDFRANNGDNVLAVADGTIEKINFDYNLETKMGYGRYVVLLHLDGSKTTYAHLEEESTANLHVGDQVKSGDVIGWADTTGGVSGPHLHFEYEEGGARIDPFPCIISPIKVVSVSIGEFSYGPFRYGASFEIQLDVPEGNDVYEIDCVKDGDQLVLKYDCFSEWAFTSDKVLGDILIAGPDGIVNATVKIKDVFLNTLSVAISTSWNCCNDPDQGFAPAYFSESGKEKIKIACFTLGAKSDTCGISQ